MNLVALALLIVGAGALLVAGVPEVLGMIGLVKFSVMPVPGMTPGMVTQFFKPPPNGHNGVDIGVPIGTPVVCVAPGVVVTVHEDPNNASGRFVIMRGRLPFPPTLGWGYAHLSHVSVIAGQEMDAGEVVGLSGNSGLTQAGGETSATLNRTDGRGAHLHFTALDVLRGNASLDPENFLPETIRKVTA